MYNLIKPALFLLDPENAHTLTLNLLKLYYQCGLAKWQRPNVPSTPCNIMGLTFPNRIGLAAGLDKNGDYIDALAALGFGFIEIGGVTPRPQAGNPHPRLFRLVNQRAIINRFNFNSKGIEHVVVRLKNMQYRGILGVNIAKNHDTPNERAVDDYLTCMQALWKFANYLVINISCPNTPGLSDLQQAEPLSSLLRRLKEEQARLTQIEGKYTPLVVKISPDLSSAQVAELADVLLLHKVDGVIATNTTRQRAGVEDSPYVKEAGGLSGYPLTQLSTQVIQQLHARLGNNIPIIASGGVMDEASAEEKLKAGAQLIQIYTGLVYSGPALIKRLISISQAPI